MAARVYGRLGRLVTVVPRKRCSAALHRFAALRVLHRAEETSIVFVVSDREIYRRLDLLTESYDDRSEGVR